jgi:hypothetical protein
LRVLTLMRNPKLDIASFDPLCAYNAKTKTTLICSHNTGHPADVQSVEMLQRIIPIERVPVEAPGHVFTEVLWQQGRLRAFYDRLFGSESGQASAERHSRAGQVA